MSTIHEELERDYAEKKVLLRKMYKEYLEGWPWGAAKYRGPGGFVLYEMSRGNKPVTYDMFEWDYEEFLVEKRFDNFPQ